MNTLTASMPTAATKLTDSTLFPDFPERVRNLVLHNPATNSGTLFFGNKNAQHFGLETPNFFTIPAGKADEIYVKGTSGDTLVVGYNY